MTCSRSPNLPASASALPSSPLLAVWSLLSVRPVIGFYSPRQVSKRSLVVGWGDLHCLPMHRFDCRRGLLRSSLPLRSPPLLASTYVRGGGLLRERGQEYGRPSGSTEASSASWWPQVDLKSVLSAVLVLPDQIASSWPQALARPLPWLPSFFGTPSSWRTLHAEFARHSASLTRKSSRGSTLAAIKLRPREL